MGKSVQRGLPREQLYIGEIHSGGVLGHVSLEISPWLFNFEEGFTLLRKWRSDFGGRLLQCCFTVSNALPLSIERRVHS